MLFNDTYYSIAREAEAVYKEKGSRFIAYALAVQTEDAFKQHLDALKREYPDATHHCYALVLHPDSSFQKSSDDGEPSHTAGKPILRAILSARLTNVAVIVVRYFGGVQLGVPGLIQAYGEAAGMVLKLAGTREFILYHKYCLQCAPEHEGDAHRFLKIMHAEIEHKSYHDSLEIRFRIPGKESTAMEKLAREFYFLKITPAM